MGIGGSVSGLVVGRQRRHLSLIQVTGGGVVPYGKPFPRTRRVGDLLTLPVSQGPRAWVEFKMVGPQQLLHLCNQSCLRRPPPCCSFQALATLLTLLLSSKGWEASHNCWAPDTSPSLSAPLTASAIVLHEGLIIRPGLDPVACCGLVVCNNRLQS